MLISFRLRGVLVDLDSTGAPAVGALFGACGTDRTDAILACQIRKFFNGALQYLPRGNH
jgi:hypothetical protein